MPNKDPLSITIDGIVKTDCDTLQSLVGDLTQAEENRWGLQILYKTKKCSFIETENDYRLYRNLELNTGAELVQSTLEIKTSVAGYIKLSDSLATSLRSIVGLVKDAKKKFSDLRKASVDLDICLNDKCNCTQVTILTGKKPATADDRNAQNQSAGGAQNSGGSTGAACPDSGETLKRLVRRPEYLLDDCDTLLTSSADVSGIQTFVNVKSIDQLQTDFSTAAKAFDTQIQAKMTQSLADLTQLQKDLMKATTDLTTANHGLYNKRDEVDAEIETIEFFCQGTCVCTIKDKDDNGQEKLKGRFDECKKKICEICHEMDNHYCQRPKPEAANA